MATYWATLPPAIIGIILNYVSREAAPDHTLARYAAVNKDWQYLFEQLTFRSLSLGPDDIPEFETIISIHSERRKWLRTVSFHDEADGGAHLGDGSEKIFFEHSPSQAVCSLLRLLQKWDPDANLRLALYLSAHTMSSLDRGNGKTFHQNAASLYLANRPCLPETEGLNQIIGELPAVKGFSIQYQGQGVSSTHTVVDLCSKLPRLEELCLQDLDHRNQHTENFTITELTRELPTTLKRLHILGQGRREPQGVCQFLVQRLVWFGTKTSLEGLSITTSEKAAEEFFEDVKNLIPGFSETWISHWPALQSLTLTCSSLRPGAPRAVANRLIHQGGLIALDLPKLRQMLLLSYNTKRPGEVDGIFRYVAEGKGKGIATCFVSEHIQTAQLVTDTWKNVAWKSHQAVLRLLPDIHPQSSLVTIQGLLGEHGGSAFEELKYPRPHWTENESLNDLLGALAFFVVLVSFLSWLVTQMQSGELPNGMVSYTGATDDDYMVLPLI